MLKHSTERQQIIESLPHHLRTSHDAIHILASAYCIIGQVQINKGQYPTTVTN